MRFTSLVECTQQLKKFSKTNFSTMKGALTKRIESDNQVNKLESVVVPLSLVLVVFETHKTNREETQSKDDTTDEAWSIEPEKETEI